MEKQEVNKNPKTGKKVIGGAILIIGIALLVKQFDIIQFPSWLFSWPMILIVIGIASGIKHQFRNSGWLIMILVGSVFLLEQISSDFSASKFWPVIIIGIGISFFFGKDFKSGDFKGRRRREKWANDFDAGYKTSASGFENETTKNDEPVAENWSRSTGDEYLDSVSVFGSTKKNVLSKSFKGGDIVTIFGGCEINLLNADINGIVELEVTQVFGGTKIILPPTWDVNIEMSAVFGGVEDKRSLIQVLPDRSKVLLIRGTSIFAGIEIRNF